MSAVDSGLSNDRQLHVLVGFAEALAAPEVAGSLLNAGHRVSMWTRASSGRPIAARLDKIEVRGITPPETDSKTAVSELRNVATDLEPDLVMPIDDGALWLAREAWPDSGTQRLVPDRERIEFALDKRRQIRAAIEAGLNVPETTEVESHEAAARLTGFPLLLRPALAARETWGKLGRGSVAFCADGQELDAALRKWDGREPLLAQPYVAGRGEGLFGCMQSGTLHAPSSHRRVRMMDPHGSGASACTATELDTDLAKRIEAMGRAIGWTGMFMCELLRDESGRPWFIEWNGRAWGSMALARRRGLEYPAWTISTVLGEQVEYVDPKTAPAFLCRHAGREILHLLHVLRGPRSKAVQQWPSRWRTLLDVLHWRRSDRWYNLEPGGWRLFLGDTTRTVWTKLKRSR